MLLLSNRDGGLTNEEGHYRFQTKVWNGNILEGFQVTPSSPVGLSITVTPGDAKVDYTNYAYTVWNTANEVVSLSTADPSNPRIDRVVLYIDRGETPQQVTPNNPGIPKIMVVAGTPAGSPVRPSDSTVNSAVGSGNPWTNLADVLVPAGVTTISGGITDTRTFIGVTEVAINNSPALVWNTWSPTITVPAGVTYTGVTINQARYMRVGKIVYYKIRVTGTLGGTPSNSFMFTLPINTVSTENVTPGSGFITTAVTIAAYSFINSISIVTVRAYDSSVLSSGTNRGFTISGFYEIA